jgi:hypothetical protein
MPYNFSLTDAQIVGVRLSGWAVVLPISFTNEAKLQGLFDKLRFVAHLSVPMFREAQFRVATGLTLTNGGPITLRLAGNDDPKASDTISLTGIKLRACESQHGVRSAETLWLFAGEGERNGEKTDVTFAPEKESFLDWGKDEHNSHGWAGLLGDGGDKPVARLAHAHVGWSGHEITSAQFVAPAGVKETRSLFNTVKSACSLFAGGVLSTGLALQKVTLEDRRRVGRTAEFFGDDDAAKAQMSRAKGAIWITQGSFLQLHARNWMTLSKGAHDGSFDASFVELMHDPRLAQTIELREPSGAGGAKEPQEGVFEGLTLWGLGQRENVQAAPVLL